MTQEPLPRNNVTLPSGVTRTGRVRDHLANERTLLSWIRTGVTMMGFGFIVEKLRFERIPTSIAPHGTTTLGIAFAAMGVVTVVMATVHYFSIRSMIENDTFEPYGKRLIPFIVLLVVVGIAVILNLAGFLNVPGASAP